MSGTQSDRNWALIIGAILALFIIVSLVSYVWMPFLPWSEERDAGQETIEQTYDAEKAIQQYEEFRELHAEIEEERAQVGNNQQALDRFYDTYGEDPNEWSRTTKERHSRLQTRITASQQQLEGLIADYNAESSKANAELFKCNLPMQVDDRLEIRGPPGSGEAEEPIQDVGPNGEPVEGEVPPAEQCDGLPDRIQQSQ